MGETGARIGTDSVKTKTTVLTRVDVRTVVNVDGAGVSRPARIANARATDTRSIDAWRIAARDVAAATGPAVFADAHGAVIRSIPAEDLAIFANIAWVARAGFGGQARWTRVASSSALLVVHEFGKMNDK